MQINKIDLMAPIIIAWGLICIFIFDMHWSIFVLVALSTMHIGWEK